MSSPPPVPPKDVPPRRSSLSQSPPSNEESDASVKRKGYTRPFPPPSFSSSAMHRTSVLALGKIEHLQHYFAVSGKLDRRGAGYAPSKRNQKSDSTYSSLQPSPEPTDIEIPLPPERDSSSPTPQAPKPASLKQTRGELLAALKECEQSLPDGAGMDIVESATTTIRLAQRYRAQIRHEDLEYEKKLRRDAVDVLVILRRIAEREGTNVTDEERSIIRSWARDIKAHVERDDEARRLMWERASSWMEGECKGNEWERYRSFLVQFDSSEPPIPPPSSDGFLDSLRHGTKLCQIHNSLTHFSRRPFGLITRYHTDTSVQYRATDNLRYFAKAAEIRWDILLEWDVEEIWRASPKGNEMFKRELAKWCHAVIDELSKIYQEEISDGEDILDELLGQFVVGH